MCEGSFRSFMMRHQQQQQAYNTFVQDDQSFVTLIRSMIKHEQFLTVPFPGSVMSGSSLKNQLIWEAGGLASIRQSKTTSSPSLIEIS